MYKSFKSLNYTEKKYSEDSYYISDKYIFVIDGASSIIKNEASNFITHNFVKEIKSYLSLFLSDNNITIQEAVKKSLNNALMNDKDNLFVKNDISSTISIARINDEYLELYYLGDSPIIIKFNDEIKEFKANDISILDNNVIQKMEEVSKNENISIFDSRNSEIIKELLLKNRKLKNRNKGYWILDTTGVGIENGNYLKLPIKEIQSILICSDGFSQIYDTLNIYNNLTTLFTDLDKYPIEDLIGKILQVQNNDVDLNKYPRFTKTDDITVIYVGEVKWLTLLYLVSE